jgi:hypothetical protein
MNTEAISGISAKIFEFFTYYSLLVITKGSNENKYCDIKVKVFKIFNKFLHEDLLLELVMFLIIVFLI